MIIRHWLTSWWLSSLVLTLCFWLAAAQKPEITVTRFPNLPARLFFLDDTSTLFYHDANAGNVYVSQDEGKNWDMAADVPKGQAMMLIEHPFQNRYAFILTKGTKHYRTEDRGKTWRMFEMPVAPAWVANPLSFHSDPKLFGYVLYQGTKCEREGWGSVCHDETYYTKSAFSDPPKLLLSDTTRCQFAHSGKDFKHDAHEDLIYCVGFDTTMSSGGQSLSNSRLFSSTDFFYKDNKVETLGIGKNARGVIAFAIVSKFAVVAMKDLSPGNNGEMLLYVSVDTKTWAQAKFPHASSAKLRENAYTIVESTTHSLGVDVVLQDMSTIGTLFVSNSNGTYFVESLKDTNRNEMGYVDFEQLYGVEGVGIANVVGNAREAETRNVPKQLQTRITFDDGRTWSPIRAPTHDSDGNRVDCSPSDTDTCSLHLHSVTLPHNFGRVFSSPAPGFVMGVGSVGPYLKDYEDCDTFLSTDAGVTWKMIRKDAHLYEFGDSGSIMVIVNDEDGVDELRYSTNLGKDWKTLDLGMKMKARALTTVPDSTSQKFVLLGQLSRKDSTSDGRYVTIFLDFANTRSRQCTESDFEMWYARTAKGKECLMGHKQWYKRRKIDADCYVGNKFDDPVENEDNCPCDDEDYECDFNFILQSGKCVPIGPEPIEAGVCPPNDPHHKYKGSSGYRLIPGNTCQGGKKKDEQVEKECSQAQPPEGDITHQTFPFPSSIQEHSYFDKSNTILVKLEDGSIWQSSNEGYTWHEPLPGEKFLVFYMHRFASDRAYLLTSGTTHYYTTDTGKTWNKFSTETPPNIFHADVLRFHPEQSDWLIWTGNKDCDRGGNNCHAEAHYTTKHTRDWHLVDKYVRNCQWARDKDLKTAQSEIICESYRDKKGDQRTFLDRVPMQLITGTNYYKTKTKVFDQVVGFAKFSEFLVVAEYQAARQSLDLQVSLNGEDFAAGLFPPKARPEHQHAYTILESSTNALFLHVTTSAVLTPPWGTILKSNSNGTYFSISQEFVNRNERGFVDFEKMIGLDGIALINVVSNPSDATVTGVKKLQSRISHNDGGSWKTLTPPPSDSQGNQYGCKTTNCALHVHGYTERRDPRATYSTPSVPGLLMAVGNVGESLAPYTESDTFLSRDAGFTWEEVHKDAHMWEFGDSGSILIMANDEEPTDHVLFTTDEGKTWREYTFGTEKLRVKSIVTVPSDTSRRFILFGSYARSSASVAVHIDFSSLTLKQCVLSVEDPGHDDFELWSPSEERAEQCLFGRRTLYHRRKRDANCVVGSLPKVEEKLVENCACSAVDFECEFNHQMNADGKCVLIPGLQPLESDDGDCWDGADYWYDRTAYRKIPYSTCKGGQELHHGTQHVCPGFKAHGAGFWWTIIMLPFAITALIAYWYYRRSGMARGTIRLPGDTGGRYHSESGVVETLASVPWFLLGLAGIAWEYVASSFGSMSSRFQSRRGYRNLPVDEDAQILRFEDEE